MARAIYKERHPAPPPVTVEPPAGRLRSAAAYASERIRMFLDRGYQVFATVRGAFAFPWRARAPNLPTEEEQPEEEPTFGVDGMAQTEELFTVLLENLDDVIEKITT